MHKAASQNHPEVLQVLVEAKYKKEGPKGVHAFVNSRDKHKVRPFLSRFLLLLLLLCCRCRGGGGGGCAGGG
eukprot:2833267-Rhodomonas_salina.1